MSQIPTSGPAITFSGSGVARRAELRRQAGELEALWHHGDTRFVPVWQGRCLASEGRAGLLTRDRLKLPAEPGDAIFLGERDGHSLFALDLSGDTPPAGLAAEDFLNLREVVSRVSDADAALLAYARAMVVWQERHRHCGVCGSPAHPAEGGFVMVCTRTDCGHRSFPRLDPAVIVLVHRGSRCLLGRQVSWPHGRFSTVAGFVEPGETLEDAVAREVHEETNVRVGHCRYIASQPWPFPAALMIGFHAEGLSEEIRFNDGELAEARWLTRPEIAAGAVVLPPRASVAFRLIEAWFDAEPGPGLANLGLDSHLFRRPDQPPEYR
jgi:NAD+ diphosphatase